MNIIFKLHHNNGISHICIYTQICKTMRAHIADAESPKTP